jgi:hypothetical protein
MVEAEPLGEEQVGGGGGVGAEKVADAAVERGDALGFCGGLENCAGLGRDKAGLGA